MGVANRHDQLQCLGQEHIEEEHRQQHEEAADDRRLQEVSNLFHF